VAEFDLRTIDGIVAAQANLDAFKASVAECVTRDLLPWGLGIGHRQMLIDRARQALSAAPGESGE